MSTGNQPGTHLRVLFCFLWICAGILVLAQLVQELLVHPFHYYVLQVMRDVMFVEACASRLV